MRRAWRRKCRGLQSISRKLSRIAPANSKFGVGLELHVLARIEFFNRVDQSHHAGMDQIVQRHLRGQPVVNAPRDVFHLRQMLEQKLLAFLLVLIAV